MNAAFENYLNKILRTLQKQVFFVAGTEKSGTTWLQMIFDQHPESVCKGEGQLATKLWPTLRRGLDEYSSFINELNKKVFSEIDHFPVFKEPSIRAVQVFSAGLLLSEYGDQAGIKAVGEKTPGHLRTLDRLKVLFPKAKFIFIFRDGRDIAVSGWYHLKRQYGEDKAEPLRDYTLRIAKVWRNDYEKVLAFAERHAEDCAIVRYEDLHSNPLPEMVRLFNFLGLDSREETVQPCIEACNFSKLAGGRERGQENKQSHFRKGIVGDWVNHFTRDAWSVFDAEAGELLEKLGYHREWTGVEVAVAEPEATQATPATVPANQPAKPQTRPKLSLRAQAVQLSKEKQWPEACVAWKKVVDTGKVTFDDWYQYATALRAIKDEQRAAEAFQQASRLDPQHENAQLMLAVTLKESGQLEAAEAEYRHLLEKHGNHAVGWRMLGMLLREQKRLPEAIDAIRSSLKLQVDVPTYNVLVMALEDSGEREQAIEAGNCLLALKDEEAMSAFRKSEFHSLNLRASTKSFSHSAPHRNVITFSLWGDDPTYVHGAIVNARIAPNLYYGWRTRFYCDKTVPVGALEEMKRHGAEVIMIDDPVLMSIKPMWRFLASDDPNVDWFICRDADSRLNAQELMAVEAWVHSGKPFHVMRDHIYHMELMLAGMWGGMAGVLPNLREVILGHQKYFNNRFSDQAFLKDFVWPLIKDKVLVHDSYYRFAGSLDFPGEYRLPRPIHVGGAIKNMPPWNH